jgi:hypothetical protein
VEGDDITQHQSANELSEIEEHDESEGDQPTDNNDNDNEITDELGGLEETAIDEPMADEVALGDAWQTQLSPDTSCGPKEGVTTHTNWPNKWIRPQARRATTRNTSLPNLPALILL